MTISQKIRARLVIRKVAKQQGISTHQCRENITAAINDAWATTDPQTKQHQIDLVGDTHIPSPEEIIFLISSKIT